MRWAPEGATLEVVTVTAPAAGVGGQVVFPRACWLLGYTARNQSDTDAGTADLYDGGNSTGDPADYVGVPAQFTQRWNPGSPGIPYEAGIYLDMTAGQLDWSFTVGEWRSS